MKDDKQFPVKRDNSKAGHVKRLEKLYELSMTLSGDPVDIFKHAARMIGELFDVRVVCLSEIRGSELHFISVYIDGQVYQNAGQCPLAATPCATVEMGKDIRVYEHVSKLFPQATFLQEHDAHAYCGFPVLDNNRNVIAVVCLLDDKPRQFNAEDQDLLRIFGQRISMEFERQRHINEQRKAEEDLRRIQETVHAELEKSLVSLRHAELLQRELRITAQREKQRLSALLSVMNIGILFEDREGRVEFVNPAFRRLWAIKETVDLVDNFTQEILMYSTHQFVRPDQAAKQVLQVLGTSEISEQFEFELCDGRIFTQLSYPVADVDGTLLGRMWIYEDITQERQTAKQLLYLAERDPLTGLQNRHRFRELLEQQLRLAKRNNTHLALLYLDLDEFKYINDTFGHRAGDTVLVRIAGEISSLVRSSEVFARLGGDEFALLISQKHDTESQVLAARIIQAVSLIPFRFRRTNIRLTVSIGIAIYPDHGLGMEDLVAHADAAMYQAKSLGKNNWCLYDNSHDLSDTLETRMTWKNRIAQALEQDLFEVYFQGIYETANETLKHTEALIRMRDPQQKDRLIMPGQFIPIAEKTGQIVNIDKRVLRHCIELLSNNPSMRPLAVNISGRTFDDPSLPQFVQTTLARHGVDPTRLIIELTETAAVSDIQDAQRFIESIQQIGCVVCLDDFGSGFSTFGYLKYLRAEILKIDGLFIRELTKSHDNQIVVKAMVDVAHGLGKVAIAEFVEDAATFKMVKELGIQFAQGYYLGKPSAVILD